MRRTRFDIYPFIKRRQSRRDELTGLSRLGLGMFGLLFLMFLF